MKKQTVFLASLVLSLSLFVAQPAFAANSEADAVRAAAGKFYAALNAMFVGDGAPMLDVWSHQDDITYMGPMGGRCLGWKEVRALWEEQTALKLGGQVRAEEMLITVSGDLAVINNFEVGENLNASGQLEKVNIRATSFFRKENGDWKMIGHHTDLLPLLAK
ncbi:MAG: nuclear transport factor 2 family protein [Planctomycetes bacterium]|nr:nuclear transport factor 2 family protein [Planctomycetota bacterium]